MGTNKYAKLILLGGIILVAYPLGLLIWQSFGDSGKLLVSNTYLIKVFKNTAALVLGVGIVATFLGVLSAAIMSRVSLPFERLLNMLLIVPLAIPSYVYAFIYSGLLSYSGPVRPWYILVFPKWLPFPEIHSLGGAIFVLSIALYPYIYLLTRNGFLTEGRQARELSQSLGLSAVAHFKRLTLPLSAPWIVGGLVLVVLEVLADFGAVSIFNVNTLSTAIYKTWYGGYSFADAARLSLVLMTASLIGLSLDYHLKLSRRVTPVGRNSDSPLKSRSRIGKSFGLLFIILLSCLSIGVPFAQLMAWCFDSFTLTQLMNLMPYALKTLLIGIMGATLTLLISFALAWAARQLKGTLWERVFPLTLIGYGIPGTVLAVGCFLAFFWFRQTLFLVLIGLSIRFLAVGVNPIAAAYQRLSPNLDEAAQSLGASPWQQLRRIQFPLLRGGIVSAFLLVCVEIMKELPITLMARPFGWDTLAIHLYQWTSESQWTEAALPALLIVILSLATLLLPKPKS